MPSTSPAQKRTMQAIAHGWKPPAASGIDIPVKVARDFAKADARIAALRKNHSRLSKKD